MEGIFEVDRNRMDEYYQQCFLRMLKIAGIGVQLPLTLIIIAYHDNLLELLIILFVSVFILMLCFWSVKTDRHFARFEGTSIVIDKTSITRKGKGLLTVSVRFQNIKHVIELEHGLILSEKMSGKLTFIFGGRYILSQNPGILFIPSMVKDFERIHNFFVLERYKMVMNDKTNGYGESK